MTGYFRRSNLTIRKVLSSSSQENRNSIKRYKSSKSNFSCFWWTLSCLSIPSSEAWFRKKHTTPRGPFEGSSIYFRYSCCGNVQGFRTTAPTAPNSPVLNSTPVPAHILRRHNAKLDIWISMKVLRVDWLQSDENCLTLLLSRNLLPLPPIRVKAPYLHEW